MTSTDPDTTVKEAKTIAVVGASNDPEKYSNEVARYLMELWSKATAASL